MYATRSAIALIGLGGEIHNQLEEYFENGTRLVWVILPDEECVLVYHKPKPSKLFGLEDSLDGENADYTYLNHAYFGDLYWVMVLD